MREQIVIIHAICYNINRIGIVNQTSVHIKLIDTTDFIYR